MSEDPALLFRVHALQRMFERDLSVRDVLQVLNARDVIEDYSADMAIPAFLVLGFRRNKPLHVVFCEAGGSQETIIITTYLPTPDRWKRGARSRRG